MSIGSSAPDPSSIATRDTTGPYNCEMCKILFNSAEELANHTQEVHKGTITSKGKRSVVRQRRRKSKSKITSSAARKSTKAKSKSKTKTSPKKRKVTTKKITNSKKRAKRSK
ncbi:MAG TPA: hypothetical protein VKA91_05850 [Nitrososphaeraceae archaeon]|nr:hypothetical protein [Nitrososphaeraceae archaeon]